MKELIFHGLNSTVVSKVSPFINTLIGKNSEKIHSIYIIGSAASPDFDEKFSDINTAIILNQMDMNFLRFLAPLGKKYHRYKIAAPLLMTPEYIIDSLDVFPIEFFEMRLIHKTVYGDDLLEGIQINNVNLRLQCEREIRARLIGLKQGYISSAGDRELLNNMLSKSITGCIPLFRAIIFLLGKEPPLKKHDVVLALKKSFSIESDILEKMLMLKNKQINPSKEELDLMFEHYHNIIENMVKIINGLSH